jgi:hypothetical protein
MATVYKFEVTCVSAFVSYPKEEIKNIIKNALTTFVDKDTRLSLESITIKEI